MRFKLASQVRHGTLKTGLARAGFGGVALILLAATLWIAVFSIPGEAPLHGPTGQPMQMIMSARVGVVDSNGQPAAKAIVTLDDKDDSQQVIADGQGNAWFEHLMLHDHFLNIVYNGEHFRQRLHVHTAENSVQLGISLEMRRNLTLLFGGLLCAWMAFGVVCSVRTQRRLNKTKPALRGVSFLRRLISDRRVVPVSMLLLSFTLVSMLFAPMAASNGTVSAAGTVVATLPVPTGLAAEADDNNAILTWNGGPLRPDQTEAAGVQGYKVSWGLTGQPLSNVQLTTYHILQLQPLINGQQYQVQVQSMDNLGNLSAPSAILNFTGSSARVDALRSRMTAFFDDFNRPAGAPDELKWNVAYSTCNDPKYSAFFINSQFHAHSMLTATNCDRGQAVSRPRQVFDFTGRTGTIAFDFDGERRRDQWYLDLSPKFIDIGGQVNIEATNYPSDPGNVLRFHQNDNVVEILYIDSAGMEVSLAKTDWNPYAPLDWLGLNTIPNVRRHWEIHLSQSKADITINGKTVLSAPLNLPFSKAVVHWNEFSYNTRKSNEPFQLGHWDNFGFDGPKSGIETHNYRTAGYGGLDFEEVSGGSTTRTINIPDSLAGEKAERLMFTLQMKTGWYKYDPNDRVVINGKSFPIPQPKGVVSDPQQLVSAINPFSVVMDLPVGTLKTGTNTLQFFFASSGLNDVHTEIDFTAGAAPTYTQPAQVNALVTVPNLPDVGPGALFEKLNDTTVDLNGTVGEAPAAFVYQLTGKVALKVGAHSDISMNATGKNPGIGRVELWLDKKPIWVQDTGGTPQFDTTYTLDTTQFTNGRHELFFVAYTPSGTASIPDYFQGDTQSGDYYPVQINISNANPGPTATPLKTTTVSATNTPTTAPATATSTPTPKPTTAPATATSTPTPKPTTVPATNTPTPQPTTAPAATATATPKPTTAPAATATATPKPTTAPATSTPGNTPGLTNLLANPGFENRLDGWFCGSGANWVTSGVHSGKGAASFASGTWDDCHQDFAMVQGKTYTLEAWVKAGTPQVPLIGVADYQTGTWYKNAACQQSRTYTRCSVTFTVPRNDRFGVFIQAQQGAFRLDDVSLTVK